VFYYLAKCKQVTDGDTIKLIVDQGFGIFNDTIFRFYKFDAPEITSKDPLEAARGEKAKEYLVSLIEGKTIEVKTYKDKKEKYGRYLCEVFLRDANNDLIDVIQEMKNKGHVK
jgi:micrococcal nuclease